VTLTGLSPSTTYHYHVLSRDRAGNLAAGPDLMLTTAPPDITPPVISAVTVDNTSPRATSVSWSTDEAADGRIEYGTSTAYGQTTALDPTLATSHTVRLTGLSPATTYHYRIHAHDEFGNERISADETFSTLAAPAIPPGAVAFYEFDESTGDAAADATVNGNTATLVNGAAFGPGLIGNGATFDGVNDSARVTRTAALEPAAVSLSAWVKLDGDQADWASVIKKTFADDTTDPFGTYALSLSPAGNTNHVTFFTGHEDAATDDLESPAPLPVGQWVHVAGTFDPATGEKRLYVNGSLVASDTVAAPLMYDSTSSGDIYLGQDPGPDEAFAGTMDDVGVWNRALTAAEIASLANPFPPGVAAASFDDSQAVNRLQFQFSKNIATPDRAALTLTNLTTGVTIPATSTAVTYNSTSQRATWTFPGFPSGTLPDGTYQATLSAAAITDTDGHPLDGNGDGAGGDDYTVAFVHPSDTFYPQVVATGGFAIHAYTAQPSPPQPVATFTDPAGPDAVANYVAQIDWGDGTLPTAGTIAFDGSTGQFTVSGSHTYAGPGTFTATTRVTHRTSLPSTATSTANVVDPSVASRWVFYNNSFFDGNDAGANAADDAAVATDKQALLPGQKAVFANYTSYSRGINGLMIDIAGLPAGTATLSVAAGDLAFAVGNDASPAGWTAPPDPSSVTIRRGGGAGGSDRVTLVWPDGVIAGEWIRVTVNPTANTGLVSTPDVFYFGNATAEAGNSASDANVTSADELQARANQAFGVPVTNRWDYNRDGRVGTADQLLARTHTTIGTAALQLITAPAAVGSTSSLVTAAATARSGASAPLKGSTVLPPPATAATLLLVRPVSPLPKRRQIAIPKPTHYLLRGGRLHGHGRLLEGAERLRYPHK
jgi:hypothetical protein